MYLPPPTQWYYIGLDEVQAGPTDDAGLRRLFQLGEIHDFTFVWNESMPSWVPMKDAPGLLPSSGIGIGACHGGIASC